MKKVLESRVFTFVLGALIFSSISVYAAHKYYASDITYKETTLDKALDTLYTKTNTYKNLTETTNVEANTLLSGKKAYKSDGTLVNGSIQTYSDAINVTPSNAQQVLQTAGKYMNSNITVGTVPSSYKDTSLATVTSASDIVSGKKAYLNDGTLVDGTGTHNSTNIEMYANKQSSYISNRDSASLTFNNVKQGKYLLLTMRTTVDSNQAHVRLSEEDSTISLNLTGNYQEIYHNIMYEINISSTSNLIVNSTTKFAASNLGGYLYAQLYKIS